MNMNKFSDLKGKVLKSVENVDDDRLIFTLNNGEQYMLAHKQECCETVAIEDINGKLSDLVGCPILMAEETDDGIVLDYHDESFTWTFYRLATVQGYVTIRWYGSSTGNYSESVDWERISVKGEK